MLQTETLDKMNLKTIDVYEKNMEKLNKIKEEIKGTSDLCKNCFIHVKSFRR